MSHVRYRNVYCFSFADQLPTEFQCVEAILDLAPGGTPNKETQQRSQVIDNYALSIKKQWEDIFPGYVISIPVIKKKIRRLLKNQYESVKISGKLPNLQVAVKTRQARKVWRKSHNKLFDLLKADVDPESFEFIEKRFYFDQKGPRTLSITEDVVKNADERNNFVEEF